MRLVLTTVPKDKSGDLANTILKSKLAGCIISVPLEFSRFFWKGEIQEEKETLVIFKTRKELVEKLFEEIKKNHPYEIPIIAEIKVEKTTEEFHKWLKEVTSD